MARILVLIQQDWLQLPVVSVSSVSPSGAVTVADGCPTLRTHTAATGVSHRSPITIPKIAAIIYPTCFLH